MGASVLRVIQGGTGAETFTSGECLVGAGTGAITTTACSSGALTNLNDETLGSIGDVSTTSLAYGYHLVHDDTNWVSTSTWPFFRAEWDKAFIATSTFSGDLQISGAATTTGALSVGADLSVTGLALMSNGALMTASSSVQGNFRIDGNATNTGSFYIGNDLKVNSLSTFTGFHSTASSSVEGNWRVDGNSTTTGFSYIKETLTVGDKYFGKVGSTTIGSGFGTKTIEEIWVDTLNKGILAIISFTDEGGLTFSWAAGEVYDEANNIILDTNASTSATCTENEVNYVISDSSADLEITTTFPVSTEILVGVVNCSADDIIEITDFPAYSEQISALIQSQQELSGTRVASGLVVSEESGGVAWDIALSAGIYYNEAYGREIVSASTSPEMWLWYHDGAGIWQNIRSTQIDTTGYDTGTGTSTVTSSSYYRSTWVVMEGNIHWVYPTTGYNTLAQCVAGVDPTIPTGIDDHPKSTTVCIRGDASAFPIAGTAAWIDVRPIVDGGGTGGTISDHGDLAGLAGGCGDHTTLGCLAEDEAAAGGWTFTSDLRVTGILHATTTDFDALQVNGAGTTTGALWASKDLTVGADLLVSGDTSLQRTTALSATTTDSFYVGGDLFITGNSTSSGAFSIANLSVNNAYWFPEVAGGNNEILKTDASGIVTWQADETGASSFAWDDAGWGVTTTTPMGFLGGSVSTASTTFDTDVRITGDLSATNTLDYWFNNTTGLTGNTSALTWTGDHTFGLINATSTNADHATSTGSLYAGDIFVVTGLSTLTGGFNSNASSSIAGPLNVDGRASTTGQHFVEGDRVIGEKHRIGNYSSSTLTSTEATTTAYDLITYKAETLVSGSCFTDTGTTTLACGDGTDISYFDCPRLQTDVVANNQFTFSTNNTFTADEYQSCNFGNTLGAVTRVSWDVKATINPD